VNRFLNTISAFQFFQLVRYATLILIGVVFAKSALGQSAIGEYETFVFIAGAVSFFWLNGLLQALLPLSSDEKKTSIFSAFLLIQFFSLLVAAALFLFQSSISTALLNGKGIPEIVLLLAFIVIGVPANLVEYFYLIKKKNKAIVIYALVAFMLQFFLLVVPVLLGYGIRTVLQALVLSSALRYVWLWVIFVTQKQIYFSGSFVRKHLKLGAPLVAASFFSGSAQFIDGFIVTSKFNEETFAVFRYGARELPLAMLLANALSNAMLARFANKNDLHDNLLRLKTSVSKLVHFLFPLTIVLLLVSKPLFPLVFNPDFAKSSTVFNVYLLLIISRLIMPQTILNGLKQSRPIMLASFLELLLNVALSLLLVGKIGIAGIALATFIAYLFEKLYLVVVVQRRLNISITQYLPLRNYILYSLLTIVIFIFAELIL
jgi:O-antigen/teichoic acid export membrane protein